jgi:hypothetical protein
MARQYLEILFGDELQADDLDIITLPGGSAPGLARLNRAKVGDPCPETPCSQPLVSRTGAKIGFVADERYIEWPFANTYWLETCEICDAPATVLAEAGSLCAKCYNGVMEPVL